jgi:1,4-alpha-glucan branching enzyme
MGYRADRANDMGEVGMTRGAFALVLHSHLPWLLHHGRWPVGEEWLYQAWATSYLPVLDVLDRLAVEGRTDLLTLGVTPVLAAQLDDPDAVQACATWIGFWSARSQQLAGNRDSDLQQLAGYEYRESTWAMAEHERRGALSPWLRRLKDAGAVELLGGPAAHPFQPLYPDEVVAASLRVGLDDAAIRFGARNHGMWAPECGYRPGLETVYEDHGITHFMVDGPNFLRVGEPTWAGRRVSDSDVVAFARDLEVTYRVWSPRRGYPSDAHYRDFHTFDHDSGFRRARVTGVHTPPELKAPYDPDAVAPVIARDAADFVDVVVARLDEIAAQRGEPGLVVAGYDTELFGHWWHEGPQWLEQVLRLLPQAGVEVTTLARARERGYVEGRVDLQPGSWGSGKDWRVWAGPAVADMVADNDKLARQWLDHLHQVSVQRPTMRDPLADQIAREALLALASDWAFMVSKDSAAQYARARHDQHHRLFTELLERWHASVSADRAHLIDSLAAAQGSPVARDRLFGHLDARSLLLEP